ncbi:MAG: tRNA pseudouridine(38-40) synthase TruA [Armatimonadota bacterium]
MRHIRLTVQYDGTDYAGFQRQENAFTIQEELENRFRTILEDDVKIESASRTDAGVHALGQICTLKTETPIPLEGLLTAMNRILPLAVSIAGCEEVDPDFHPQYDAVGKLYSYRILNRNLPSPFINRYAWHVEKPLNVKLMHQAAGQLIGEHDFASFMASGGSVTSTVRRVERLDVVREGDLVEIRIWADGFLYMMVRNIVGTLVEIGRGDRDVSEMTEIRQARDRTKAGMTAPPQGLCLVRVDYEK